MAKGKSQKQTESSGGFQWILFIIIPLVFALTITLVILSIAGVDVLGTAKKAGSNIPVVSSILGDETETTSAEPDKEMLLQEELEAKDEEISHLEEQNSMNERTIEELNQDVVKLKNRIEQEPSVNEESTDDKVKDISRSFNEMDAEAAAAIMDNLEQELALALLDNIPMKERGAILEAMEPVRAAELTSAFMNTASGQ